LLVTGGVGSLRITELSTGRTLREARVEQVVACEIDPSGEWVAVAEGYANAASVWNVRTGERRFVLSHDGPVEDVRISPDGTTVATASWDGNARLWSSGDGKLLHAMAGHGDQVNTVAFSPDGKRLVSVGQDQTARLWDVATGKSILTLRGHHGIIYGATFSATGDRLVTTSEDGTARLWDLTNGRLISIVVVTGKPVVQGTLSPDDKLLAGASGDRILLWAARDPFDVDTVRGDDSGCASGTQPVENLAIASCTHLTRVIDLRAGRIADLPEGSTASGVAPDGRHAVSAKDRIATAWDVDTKTALARVEVPAPAAAFAWSHHAEAVAIGTAGGDVMLWRPLQAQLTTIDHMSAAVTSIAWNAAGLLVVGDERGNVHFFHPGRDSEQKQRFELGAGVELAQFSADGSRFAVNGGAWVEVRDALTGASLCRLHHELPVADVAFDESGERIFTGSRDSIGRVFRVSDGALRAELAGSSVQVDAPVLVGSSLAASSGADGAVHFWDLDRQKEIFVLRGTGVFAAYLLHPTRDTYTLVDSYANVMTWHLRSTGLE
jgi:WD40 repeat protein